MTTSAPLRITPQQQSQYQKAFEFAQQQVKGTMARTPDYFPIYTENGKWHHQGELWTDWTGGFFAGMMWRFFHVTNNLDWRTHAEHYSKLLEHRQHDRDVHDLGFIFLNTYLPWYELTKDEHLHNVLVQAGRTLAMRFMEAGQYLRSFVAPESLFIDIMMNVPIIFYAAQETGDEELLRKAVTHCRTTRDTMVRIDGSTAHEGIFDLQTGEFVRQSTHQGLRGDSAWARGLGWSLAGYARVADMTGSEEFLQVSERNAYFWLANLPQDKVPYWDFDADLDAELPWGPQKDSSAAAIVSGGLLRLAKLTRNPVRAENYRRTALDMLDALVQPEYLAINDPDWEGILKHGVYHTEKNLGVDESVMWGEFFFVDALATVLQEAKVTG